MVDHDKRPVYRGIIHSRSLFDDNQEGLPPSLGLLSTLNLTTKELKSCRILEVGGGGGDTLEEAVMWGLDWNYIDPLLELESTDCKPYQENIRRLLASPEFAHRITTGIAAKMPYADKEFNICVSLFAIPLVCFDYSDAVESVREMIRVTKDRIILNLSKDYRSEATATQLFHANQTPIGQGSGNPFFTLIPLKDYLDSLEKQGIITQYTTEPCLKDPKETVLTIFPA